MPLTHRQQSAKAWFIKAQQQTFKQTLAIPER
ncbi:hypothetical protein BLA18109_04355 [Burkholderia lata]|uniref:Uncharacterized protein n=1 Tax=Burkholderia lata (strain ATCC 17760 / DSM 23089 / LMG 22485 / NCIMB 9086 / R18194 / 383) TaxID=482957 RepID=A0A6P2W2K8_BURL3|nr:hypothetical protein BLA18109_04355 [Burkholderia lata]